MIKPNGVQAQIYNRLRMKGYNAMLEVRLSALFPNDPRCSQLAVDIYLPQEKVVIEVNGDSHYRFGWAGVPCYEVRNERDARKRCIVRDAGLRQIDMVCISRDVGVHPSLLDLAAERISAAIGTDIQYQELDIL
jgi:hypothetical protein